jgi:L-serine dehydratase
MNENHKVNIFGTGKVKSSIFNDVLGPVMRGPSSSHTAASWRIARIAVQILDDELGSALVEFDRHGVWASNYVEQGTALGMNAGLLGIDMTDDKILELEDIAGQLAVKIEYKISDFETDHPNTVRLTLHGRNGKSITLTGVSTGGGMFEIRKIDDFPVRLFGDDHELVVFFKHELSDDFRKMIDLQSPENCYPGWYRNNSKDLLIIQSSKEIPDIYFQHIIKKGETRSAVKVAPVMPIVRGNEKEYPFDSVQSMINYGMAKNLGLGELGVIYEQCRSGLEKEEVIRKMKELVSIIENSISKGLAGTVFKDRVLQQQSHLIGKSVKDGRLLSDDLTNRIISNVSALMESKSSLGVIVAAPTAGACGALGGTLKAIADYRQLDDENKILAYFAAGMIGVFIAEGPGFSAEEFGCQVECGAASSMTAAALAEIAGGSVKNAVDAASMALQNMIGLICDPIADRVEAPCLGKNISAAMNALSSSTMALSGFDALIPLDQVIQTVYNVGKTLPFESRCTGLGGLAATPRALEIKEQLRKKNADKTLNTN